MPALPDLLPLHAVPDDAVETLLDTAFGRDRHGRTAYRLRDGMQHIAALSFAAVDAAGMLLGVLQSWPIALHDARRPSVPLVLVGPVAVDPAHQRGGLGRTLMTRMLRAAEDADPLVLIGDPEYYGRFFGFSADATADWQVPGPVERRRLLARANGACLPAAGMLGPRR